MPDIVLFGATGYTGRLTAHALARRGADFAVAGRDPAKLEALSDRIAETTDRPETLRASAGDVDGLTRALDGAKVLVTCVGPFRDHGDAAAEAALRAGVNYIDSTGESDFIARLVTRYDRRAREAGITMAPALGFDEVPADSAATLATEGMEGAELVLTYALPSVGSRGTLKSAVGISAGTGNWLEDGRPRVIRAGEATRWSPMPPPLGPKSAISFPLAEGQLAPLHLDLRSLQTYVTVDFVLRNLTRVGAPLLRLISGSTPGRRLIHAALDLMPEGPNEQQRRGRWTILAEARTDKTWRNVSITGEDVYGLTAEFLTTGAMSLSKQTEGRPTGVVSPVQALGIDRWQKEFVDRGVVVDIYQHR